MVQYIVVRAYSYVLFNLQSSSWIFALFSPFFAFLPYPFSFLFPFFRNVAKNEARWRKECVLSSQMVSVFNEIQFLSEQAHEK